ncbi:hypothetical protein AB0F81_13985 [Actinoplanes sp. NPDC024001]|uniref:HAAS signaling domain-containing protein n=1 Tax=Actinoplanes sp. NPDC024001 TaxID=3154598 RepID=UPI0033EE7B15
MDGWGDPRIDAYLAEVAGHLSGPRRRRERILDELRDGLHEAAAGFPGERAVDAAIAEFGPPRRVAEAFAGELAIAYGRRTLTGLLVTGPLIGALWLLALRLPPWRTGLVVLLVALPVLPLVAVAVVVAVRAVATTGSLMRWLPETGPRQALLATAVVAALAVVADAVLIARYAGRGSALTALAVTVSAARLLAGLAVLHRLATWPSRLEK